MAYQLIYTSYSSSLIKGRTGFSTVAMSASLPERLVPEIQRISQYDIPQGVVFAHRIILFGGEKYHVLTRTKDCGLDYTNRNNYIAHHLIFEEKEISRLYVSPAEVMLSFNQWCDLFTGEPRYIPEIRLAEINSRCSTFLPAQTWRERFGDCGYAASLVRKTAMLYATPTDAVLVLKLYAEALLLYKSISEEWSVPFTTQLLPSDRRIDFTWCASATAFSFDINVVEGKAKEIPITREAEYARTGTMTNSERFNLKVSDNLAKNRTFNVVVSEKSRKPLLVFAVLTLIAIAGVIGYFVWAKGEGFSKQMQTAQTAVLPKGQKSAKSQSSEIQKVLTPVQQKHMSMTETLSAAREKIDSCDFEGAIALWRKSKYANKKFYEAILNSDISAKIDAMYSFAENVSLNDSATDKQKKQAIKYLEILSNSGEFMTDAKRENILSKSAEILNKLR